MNRLLFLALLLVAHPGRIDGCRQEEKDHLQAIRTKVLHAMRMNSEQVHHVPVQAVEGARQLLPMMDTHHQPEHEKFYALENKDATLAPGEHLFTLPYSATDRDLLGASLNVHILPSYYPATRMSMEVKAREVGSEASYHVASDEFTTSRHAKQLRVKIPTDDIMRWLETPSQSIVLSIEVREMTTGDAVLSDEVVAADKGMVLELDVTAPTTRKRRTTSDSQLCKDGEPNQECCIQTKTVTLEELGFDNVVTPVAMRVAWCEGQCKKKSSFAPLFDGFTSQIFDAGRDVPRCCHAVESGVIDLMFVTKNGEIHNERLHDVAAKKCICS